MPPFTPRNYPVPAGPYRLLQTTEGKMRSIRWPGFVLLLCLASPAVAQPDCVDSPVFVLPCNVVPAADMQYGAGGSSASSPALWRRNALVLGTGAVLVGAYGNSQWWGDGFKGGFKTRNEGWFGSGTENGGADKLGHLYANYVGARLLTALFEGAGNDREQAISLGAWSTFGAFTAIEVIDGFSERWRFSREDFLVNAAGAALGAYMERNKALDDLFDVRLRYEQSADAKARGRWDAFGDYSGQTYLLVAKASGVPQLRDNPWLRYMELSVGFGSRNFDATVVPGDKTRNLFAGLSINLGQLINDTVFRDATRVSGWQRASHLFFDTVQVPKTGVYAEREYR